MAKERITTRLINARSKSIDGPQHSSYKTRRHPKANDQSILNSHSFPSISAPPSVASTCASVDVTSHPPAAATTPFSSR